MKRCEHPGCDAPATMTFVHPDGEQCWMCDRCAWHTVHIADIQGNPFPRRTLRPLTLDERYGGDDPGPAPAA